MPRAYEAGEGPKPPTKPPKAPPRQASKPPKPTRTTSAGGAGTGLPRGTTGTAVPAGVTSTAPAPTRQETRRAARADRKRERQYSSFEQASKLQRRQAAREAKQAALERQRQPYGRGIAPTGAEIQRSATLLEAGAAYGPTKVAPKRAGMQKLLGETRRARQAMLSKEQFDKLYLGTRDYAKYVAYVARRRDVPVSAMVAINQAPIAKQKFRRMLVRAQKEGLRGRFLLDNGMVFPFGAEWATAMGGKAVTVNGRVLAGYGGTAWVGGQGSHEAKPKTGWQSDHAIDIWAPMGTPIYAVADGVVSDLNDRNEGLSAYLTINGNTVWYTHMSGFASGLQSGQRVRKGQLIGFSGASDNGAPHLHIAVENGSVEDLLDYGTAGGVR